MKKTLIILTLILSLSVSISGQIIDFGGMCEPWAVYLWNFNWPSCNNNNYVLQFEDNFNGNSLDLSKWRILEGVPRDSNFELQKAWHTKDNIEISNGTLKIIAKKPAVPVTGTWVTDWSTSPYTTKTSTFKYTTAEIWSKNTFKYGKYEVRFRIPQGKGFWPAFWTYGGPGWNEIDFFELYGSNINKFTCNVHHDFDGDGSSEKCGYNRNSNLDFSQWHTLTCIFDLDKIIWMIDGYTIREYYTFYTVTKIPITCDDNIANGVYYMMKSFPVENMSIILNMAIESGDKAPDANTTFPSAFEIDYVRFYKRENCCSNLIIKSKEELELNSDMYYINYVCGNNIEIDGNITIKNNENLNLTASNIIVLKPGLIVEKGAHFNSSISSVICNSSLKSAKVNYENIDYYKTNNIYPNIYPNPTDDKIIIDFSEYLSKNEFFINIYNMEGKLIIEQKVSDFNEVIDFSNHSDGLYILRILDNSNKCINTSKISVNR